MQNTTPRPQLVNAIRAYVAGRTGRRVLRDELVYTGKPNASAGLPFEPDPQHYGTAYQGDPRACAFKRPAMIDNGRRARMAAWALAAGLSLWLLFGAFVRFCFLTF